MSQFTPTPTPCLVCGRSGCDQHANARIVRLAPALVARLNSAPHSNIWTRYQVEPGAYGLAPLTLYVNPVNAPLTGAFWVKEVETRKGDVHHASVYLGEDLERSSYCCGTVSGCGGACYTECKYG